MVMSSPLSSSKLPTEWKADHDIFICRLSALPDLLSLEQIISALRDTFPELRFGRLTQTAIDVRLQILEFRGAGLFADVLHPNNEEWEVLTDKMSHLLSPRPIRDKKRFYSEKNESEPDFRVTTPISRPLQSKRSVTYGFCPTFEAAGKTELVEVLYFIPDEEPGIVDWTGTRLRAVESVELERKERS